MTITNTRKAELRWEIIDGAFARWEQACEQEGSFTDDELDYIKQAVIRAAKALKVDNHMYL